MTRGAVLAASFAGLVSQYGYFGIAGLVFVESFGVPAPGETAIVLGAISAGQGRLNIFGVAAVAFLAAVVGDSLGYLIGRTAGRSAILRYGRYLFLTPERLDRVEAFMDRHGPKMIVVARFVEGLRQLNGIVAGVAELPWPRFLLFNTIGAAAWVGVWSSAGYLAGNHLLALQSAATRYESYLLVAAAVVVAGLLGWRMRRRRRERARAG